MFSCWQIVVNLIIINISTHHLVKGVQHTRSAILHDWQYIRANEIVRKNVSTKAKVICTFTYLRIYNIVHF